MRKVLLFLGIALMVIVTVCSSPEADEVLNYHNDMVDDMNPKLEQIEELYGEMETVDTEEEAVEIHTDKILPVITEIKEFFDSQDPKEDVTKDYHEMRSKSINSLSESIQMENDIFVQLLSEEMDEEELMTLMEESEAKAMEATEQDEEANEKWEDISEEFDFEEDEIED